MKLETVPMFAELPQDNPQTFERSQFNFNMEKLIKRKCTGIAELSRKTLVADATLHDWMTGKVRFPIASPELKRVAEFFELSVDQLVYGEWE
jgi:hypothetical protein